VYKKLLGCILLAVGNVGLVFRGILPDPVQDIFVLLGLMSIPLFAHALVLGFFRTRDSGAYFLRLTVVASLTQFILYLFISRSDPGRPEILLNPIYALVIAFGLIYGLEILIPCGPQRIASMRLLEANAQTKSDRFDIRVSSRDMVEWPDGLKVPNWSIATLQLFGISLVVFCLVLPIFLPIEYGLFGVLLVAIFYAIEKVVSGRKAVAAFFCMLMLIAAYTYLRYRMTGEFDPIGVSIASVFLCYIPEKARRPKRAIQYAFYLFFPAHILVLLLLRLFFFSA
jgi:hypothetical protein